jgi:hypothetical protein
MSMQNSTLNSRYVFENASAVMNANGIGTQDAILTQSDLVLEQQLLTTLTSYTFPVLSNDNGPSGSRFNTEVRLQQQDTFVASAWGFFLAAPSSANDATFIVHTYPDPVVFTGGASAAAETLYNSVCKITVNNQVILPVWHLSRHRAVPQSQQVAGDTGVYPGIAYDQIDLSSDGFHPVEPNILFVGSKGYQIVVNLPAALAAVTTFQRARMHYRGVLGQNTTIIT